MIDQLSEKGNEEVNIEEFVSQIKSYPKLREDKTLISKKNDGLLTFKCLFMDEHSDTKGANAYAYKRDGRYFASCQGEVCQTNYSKLNRYLDKFTRVDFGYDLSKVERLPFSEDKMTIYKAPTGSGKTTKIIYEMMATLNEDKKIFIVLPSKAHIDELKARYDRKSDDIGLLERSKKLFVFTSETNDDHFKFNLATANIIITHHHYLKTKGHIGARYSKINEIYNLVDKVVIDEGDRFLDLVHANSLLIGGLYKEETRFDGTTVYKKNHKMLRKEEIAESMEIKTNILEPIVTNYRTIEFRTRHELIENLQYVDLYKEVVQRFKLIRSMDIDNFTYDFYKNPNSKQVVEREVDDSDLPYSTDLTLDYANAATVVKNRGDDIKRKQIGDINLVLTYDSILDELKSHPNVLITSATFTSYHYDLLENYQIIEAQRKLKDVDRIIVLRKDEYSSRTKHQVLDFVGDNDITTLSFFGTKHHAEKLRKRYPDKSMFVDNGVYSVSKRSSIKDSLQQRTVTLIGLESIMSIGYNYIEEIKGEGFELMYFDKVPISPDYKKYYLDGDYVKQIKDSYNLNVYLQAIGRGFRMEKNEITIVFNEIDDDIYDRLMVELDRISNANIIEAEYNQSNLKTSVWRHIERVAEDRGVTIERLCNSHLKNNQLIQERMKHGLFQTETTSKKSAERYDNQTQIPTETTDRNR